MLKKFLPMFMFLLLLLLCVLACDSTLCANSEELHQFIQGTPGALECW